MKNVIKLCLLLILIIKSEHGLFAQNVLDKVNLDSSSPPLVAYSMRKLSTTYTGFAIQVRRSNDDAIQDIGFTASGNLDETALTTFVGLNSGFISKWYDQSGNARDLIQPNAINQPRIVVAGIIQKENDKPFVRFYGHNATQGSDGTVDYLQLSAMMTTTGYVAVVNKFASSSDGFILGNTGDYKWHSDNATLKLFHSGYASASILQGKVWQNRISVAPVLAAYNTTLMVNTIVPNTPASGTEWNNIGSDRLLYHDTDLGGGYAELIVFAAELSNAARTALIESQVSYYNTVITDRLLNRNGQLTPSLPDQINQNGARGLSGLLRTGEKIAY